MAYPFLHPQFTASAVPMDVTLTLAYRKPGNVVASVPVDFTVEQTENFFSVRPRCEAPIRRLVGLPDRFSFEIFHSRISAENPLLGTLAHDLVQALIQTHQLRLP